MSWSDIDDPSLDWRPTVSTLTRLRPDGILEGRPRHGLHVETGASAAEWLRVARELTGGHPHPTLIDASHATGITAAATRVYSGDAPVSRIAFVVPNPVSRVVMSVFMGMAPLPCPARLFGDVHAALAWLREQG